MGLKYRKSTNIYGYATGLQCYQDIQYIYQLGDKDIRRKYLDSISTSKMRSMKSRLKSKGTIGIRDQLTDGILGTMSTLSGDEKLIKELEQQKYKEMKQKIKYKQMKQKLKKLKYKDIKKKLKQYKKKNKNKKNF